MESGGWELTANYAMKLPAIRKRKPNVADIKIEREASNFNNRHSKGFWTKTITSPLAALGYARYEIPLNSRTVKGFTTKIYSL